MAKVLSFLLFTLILSFSAKARNALRTPTSYSALGHDDATPQGSNFTFVCDPSRYASLGLDMSKFAF